MERGLFQARLEVAFCLAQSPEHEIMAKPKKEEKGAVIPIKNREGFYPQPLQPHSSCDVEAVGFRSTNSCQRARISSRSRKTGLTAS